MAQIKTTNFPSPVVGQTGSVNWQASQIMLPLSADPADRYGGVPTLRIYNDSGCTLLLQFNNGFQYTLPPRDRLTMPCPLDIYQFIWTIQGISGTSSLPNLYVDLFQPNDPLPILGGAGGNISAADVLPGTFPAGTFTIPGQLQITQAPAPTFGPSLALQNNAGDNWNFGIVADNLVIQDSAAPRNLMTFDRFTGNVAVNRSLESIGQQATVGAFGVSPIIGSATAAPTDATLDTILSVTAPATGLYRVSFAGFRARTGSGNVTAETSYTDQAVSGTAFFSTNAGIVLNSHNFTLPTELACTAIIFQADAGTTIAVKFQDTGVNITANPISVVLERLI